MDSHSPRLTDGEAPRRVITRRDRTERAAWCAKASCSRGSGLRIEPGRHRERGDEAALADLAFAGAADQKIAGPIDRAFDAALDREPRQIRFGHPAEPGLLPGIGQDRKSVV